MRAILTRRSCYLSAWITTGGRMYETSFTGGAFYRGMWWPEFNDETEVGCGGGNAFVVDASVANKARITIDYRVGMAVPWPDANAGLG
jgi:hypothetical protein